MLKIKVTFKKFSDVFYTLLIILQKLLLFIKLKYRNYLQFIFTKYSNYA